MRRFAAAEGRYGLTSPGAGDDYSNEKDLARGALVVLGVGAPSLITPSPPLLLHGVACAWGSWSQGAGCACEASRPLAKPIQAAQPGSAASLTSAACPVPSSCHADGADSLSFSSTRRRVRGCRLTSAGYAPSVGERGGDAAQYLNAESRGGSMALPVQR